MSEHEESKEPDEEKLEDLQVPANVRPWGCAQRTWNDCATAYINPASPSKAMV